MSRDDEGPEVDPRKVPRRSHAAIPVVLALLVIGLILGYYSVAVPFLLGVVLLGVLVSFLSIRINPLGTGFYLTTKPSWSAIGTVFLSSLVLFAGAFLYYLDLHAPILPVPLPVP